VKSNVIFILIVSAVTFPFFAKASIFNEPTALYSSSRTKFEATNPMEFHEKRKMGVGTVFSGATGLLGAHMQFFLGTDFALGVGYGGADNLKALNVYFRELLTNNTFSFYWTAGYARWWNNGGKALSSSRPDYLYERFLSPSEKASGTFVEHIIYPGIGGQFYNLSGDFAGTSFYAEGLLITDVGALRVNPALGLGAFYYF
jgi:hypothetical protein